METELKKSFLKFLPIVILFIALVLLELKRGMWLDDHATWWSINSTLKEVLIRNFYVQGQPYVYSVPLWAFCKLFGFSPISLKFLSIIFSAVSVFLLYKLLNVFFHDKRVAFFSLPLFLSMPVFLENVVNARPYALAIMSFLLSTIYWIYIVRGEFKIKYVCLYAFSAACVFYCNYIWGLAVFVQFLIGLYCSVTNKRRFIIPYLSVYILLGVLCFFGVYHMYAIKGRMFNLDFIFPATFGDISSIFLTFISVTLFLLMCKRNNFIKSFFNFCEDSFSCGILFAVLLLFVPIFFLVSLSYFFDFNVYAQRYFQYNQIGLIILVSLFLGSLKFHRIADYSFIILIGVTLFSHYKGLSDYTWKAAFEEIKFSDPEGTCPIVLETGFPESQKILEFMNDPLMLGFLRSPADYYKMKNKIIISPISFEPEDGKVYYENYLQKVISEERCFYVVYRDCLLRIYGEQRYPAHQSIWDWGQSNSNYTLEEHNIAGETKYYKAIKIEKIS